MYLIIFDFSIFFIPLRINLYDNRFVYDIWLGMTNIIETMVTFSFSAISLM